jgi:hypothetical protein
LLKSRIGPAMVVGVIFLRDEANRPRGDTAGLSSG